MGMKKTNASMAMMGMLGMGVALSGYYGSHNDTKTVRKPLTKEQVAERKRLEREVIEDKRRKNYGLTEYFYGEKVVFARNKKNADRKAKNKGYM